MDIKDKGHRRIRVSHFQLGSEGAGLLLPQGNRMKDELIKSSEYS